MLSIKNTTDGYLKDVEIKGNTVQNAENLADIRSVGTKVEGQELYEIPVVSCNGLDSSDSNYQEDKLTILSPVQLEKVGDVADRIICKDGVWGVEKNITQYILNGTNCNIKKSDTNNFTNVVRFWISDKANPDMNIATYKSVICDRLKSYGGDNSTIDEESIANSNGLDIHISKSKLESEDVYGLNEYLKLNNMLLIYQTTQPQFIPLPHDQQIKLRTFAGQTNIHFETEIEGTIKAQVPKSIGASINTHTEQIANLNNELNRVKKLEESAVSTVKTESNFTTVEETSNGYFEDVKLEGKTLVINANNEEVEPGTEGAILMSAGQDVEEVSVESVNADETQSDRKYLLYYNPTTQTWEKPILREWDTIEKHSDGKYYYHKRSGEVVYTEGDEETENYITDLINTVKPLAQEEVYECTNIDLITYANETNYIVSSGAISPKSTLKVHSNISNVVKILQEKVSLLENNVKASQEVQDMMILESDMRILDMELVLMEYMPITLNLGRDIMFRSATYFNFLKNHIENETYEKEYLENVMNKYLATNRLTQEEYDELYKLLYPPKYDIELPIEY